MADRLATTVSAAGLREYYDPFTGEGMGAPNFSWSALIMELIDPEVYGLPPDPTVCTRDLGQTWKAAAPPGGALLGTVLAAFAGTRR
jgi:hypothetical protein